MSLLCEISELKKFVRVHKTMNINSFIPFLDRAEAKVSQLLGEVLYSKLTEAYEADNLAAYDKYTELHTICQRYLANFALYEGFHQLRNHVSELGIQQTYDDSAHTSRPAPVADAKALRLEYCKATYQAADDLLLFLEKNQNTNSLLDWKASDFYTENYELLIRNAATFSNYVSGVKSRQTFVALKPQIRLSETLYIKKTLCEDLYKDLKNYVLAVANNLPLSYPAEYSQVLNLVLPLLATDSMLRGLAFLDLTVEGENLYLSEYVTTDYTNKASTERQIEQYRQQLKADKASLEKELIDYLNNNANNLPKFFNSSCYTKKEQKLCLTNNANSSSFMIS